MGISRIALPALLPLLAIAPARALGQAPAAIAERCRAPEYRQFDFWIGSWSVRNAAGQLLGHNEITAIGGGCGLAENWTGASGGAGSSINAYDAALGRWTQRWVGDGSTLWLEGSLRDGRMVLAGTAPRATANGNVLDRITWTPLPDGRLSQVWEVSADGGASWSVVFEGFYERSGTPSPSDLESQ